jgi:hypothetical protein
VESGKSHLLPKTYLYVSLSAIDPSQYCSKLLSSTDSFFQDALELLLRFQEGQGNSLLPLLQVGGNFRLDTEMAVCIEQAVVLDY